MEQPRLTCGTRRRDSDAVDLDIYRLPPPPLRLSWPLCTLRRFGFYGNTLFKLEAGRRAPRGEGHYLFRIRTLREFRQYFECDKYDTFSWKPFIGQNIVSSKDMQMESPV
ncbi:unnamed protein product [Echinostoma caproni]|uniref:IRS-type PTB domain-containing protein n=1 Tax=Echinostoma caproni TaxID=27848 RepID=A0A183B2V1_9TREM|nr:unnamed protein product [Echinostoma caproni]